MVRIAEMLFGKLEAFGAAKVLFLWTASSFAVCSSTINAGNKVSSGQSR
jgi:hypothetical protein